MSLFWRPLLMFSLLFLKIIFLIFKNNLSLRVFIFQINLVLLNLLFSVFFFTFAYSSLNFSSYALIFTILISSPFCILHFCSPHTKMSLNCAISSVMYFCLYSHCCWLFKFLLLELMISIPITKWQKGPVLHSSSLVLVAASQSAVSQKE